MRKYIIYCLVAMLLVGLVPIGASAENNIYEITIYPNGKDMQTLSVGEESLVLGNVEVDYYVDYYTNTVDVYFSEPIFIDRVNSKGNTVHKTIEFGSGELIEVNEDLDTDFVVGSTVENISFSYENIEEVESITIQSSEYDFSGGLLDNVIFIGNVSDLKNMTDNDINTKTRFIYIGDKTISYSFDDVKDIGSMKYYMSGSSFTSGSILLQFYDELDNLIYEYKVNDSAYKFGYQEVDINLNDVKKVSITINSNGNTKYIHEFNLYESVTIEKPLEEVTNLDYTVEDDNVILTWTNPESENFEGVNIYRDGELIETTTEESFSESLPSGIYQYRITTLESGKESPGITIDVLVQSAPTTVKNIRMINRTATGGSVTWDLNPAFENVEKYIVYVNGEKHGEIEAPPYPLKGLEEGKTYTISVQAVNSYGISEPPTSITYTPTKLSEIKDTIRIGDIFTYLTMLFANMWPLLALALAIIISPKIYNMLKSNVT